MPHGPALRSPQPVHSRVSCSNAFAKGHTSMARGGFCPWGVRPRAVSRVCQTFGVTGGQGAKKRPGRQRAEPPAHGSAWQPTARSLVRGRPLPEPVLRTSACPREGSRDPGRDQLGHLHDHVGEHRCVVENGISTTTGERTDGSSSHALVPWARKGPPSTRKGHRKCEPTAPHGIVIDHRTAGCCRRAIGMSRSGEATCTFSACLIRGPRHSVSRSCPLAR